MRLVKNEYIRILYFTSRKNLQNKGHANIKVLQYGCLTSWFVTNV